MRLPDENDDVGVTYLSGLLLLPVDPSEAVNCKNQTKQKKHTMKLPTEWKNCLHVLYV